MTEPTFSKNTYVEGLIDAGATKFVRNAPVEVRWFRLGSYQLPLVIPKSGTRGGDSTSICSHYIDYTREEICKRATGGVRQFWDLNLRFLGLVLRSLKIDQVVYLNNWLLATSPAPSLSVQECQEARDRLVSEFPDRAIVFRSANPNLDPDTYKSLSDAGYSMIRSRRVFSLTPEVRNKRNLKEDLRLLHSKEYELVCDEDLAPQDYSRLAELYSMLYLEKYSQLNGHLTPDFFQLVRDCDLMGIRALKRNGRLDGFCCYLKTTHTLYGFAIGYDLKRPQSQALYRRCMALFVQAADEYGLSLHLSAGSERFKIHRGAVGSEEYDAVYLSHLPLHRRLGWRVLQLLGAVGSWRGGSR